MHAFCKSFLVYTQHGGTEDTEFTEKNEMGSNANPGDVGNFPFIYSHSAFCSCPSPCPLCPLCLRVGWKCLGFSSGLDGFDDIVIARAAAQVAVEFAAVLFFAVLRVALV